MKKVTFLFVVLLVLLVLVSAAPLKQNPGIVKSSPIAMTHDINFQELPLDFIVNKGQVDKKAAFYARTSFYTLWVTAEGLVFDSMEKVAENNFKRDVSRMMFLGANPKPVIAAIDKTRHRVNYFQGSKKSLWYTDIPTSSAVVYQNLYNRIHLKVYGIQQEIEYDWIVEPKGNPEDIRIRYKNVLASTIDREGNLMITTSFGKLTHKKPVSYQWSEGNQVPVNVSYKKIGDHVYAFTVGDYDKSKELVIDPAVLIYSTYFGGSGAYEYVYDFTTDGEGLVYFTGATTSSNFPTYNASDSSYYNNGNFDVFVSVLDTTQGGSSGLIYSTYMGHNGVDQGHGIAVDADGIIYVTGTTWDGDSPYFPTTDSSLPQGAYDIFVAKFDPSEMGENTLLFSTMIGGSQDEVGRKIAVDSAGSMYIVGYTRSSQSGSNPFPLSTNAYQNQLNGSYDFFLIKMNINGTIAYSTYLGGGSGSTDEYYSDYNYVGVDSNGYVYMVGLARADDFPIKPNPGALKTSRSSFDGFISIFDPSQSIAANTLVYSTFFGGSAQDQIYDIVIDDTDVYITGKTESDSGTNGFPITSGAYQSTRSGFDAFVTKFDYSSSQLNIQYSSYLGGSGSDQGSAINVDASGDVYVAGRTISSDFPTNNSYQSCVSGNYHAFISILDLSAGTSGLIFSSCLGGSANENGLLAGFDSSGNVIVAGSTKSSNFPVTSSPEAYQDSRNGSLDVFITVLDPGGE
jgi:hypothetical protein